MRLQLYSLQYVTLLVLAGLSEWVAPKVVTGRKMFITTKIRRRRRRRALTTHSCEHNHRTRESCVKRYTPSISLNWTYLYESVLLFFFIRKLSLTSHRGGLKPSRNFSSALTLMRTDILMKANFCDSLVDCFKCNFFSCVTDLFVADSWGSSHIELKVVIFFSFGCDRLCYVSSSRQGVAFDIL